jgi:uncharacterized protein DUF4388
VALTGTLKDFGIAEILQLIGQQMKSGVLHLESRDDEIHIALAEGNVVRAESAGRKARERLGNMLVRAEIITREELDYALDLQKRSLRRLGDLLVELDFIAKDDLQEMTALQTTETIYRLFHWKSGTYAFEAGEVEWDAETVTPLRAESVLMEGFRRVDEWPMVRKRITSTAMSFEPARPLEPMPAPEPLAPERTGAASAAAADADGDVDAAFDGLGEAPEERRGEFANVGEHERRVHALALPGRTVEKIVDLSRIGEFETCKALTNLVNLGYLRAIGPAGRTSTVGAHAQDGWARLRTGAARVLATLAVAAALAGLAYWADPRGLIAGADGASLGDNGAQRFLARCQVARLRGALEVYRLERGEYPAALGALVDAGLTNRRDLRHPWANEYFYRRGADGGFVLLPPIE